MLVIHPEAAFPLTSLSEIKRGDCFMYNNMYYIAGASSNGIHTDKHEAPKRGVTNLATGDSRWLAETVSVRPIRAVVKVTEG